MSNTVKRYTLVKERKPERDGTNKKVMVQWAAERPDGFTMEEFLEFVKTREGFPKPSVLKNEGKAWWNEFANKFEIFVEVK